MWSFQTVTPAMEFSEVTEVKSWASSFKLILLNKTVRNELRDLCQYIKWGSGFYELLSTHCQKLHALELEKIQSNSIELSMLLQIHSLAAPLSVDTAQRGNVGHSGVKISLFSRARQFPIHSWSVHRCLCKLAFLRQILWLNAVKLHC